MKRQFVTTDYECPQAFFLAVEERCIVCVSGTVKTEDFDDIEDFEW